MPRRPRLFVSGGYSHIYFRTHRGERRFDDRSEADAFVQAVVGATQAHGIRVLAWSLMCNHYHLAVRTADVKLWRTMARIHCEVTRAHNRRHRIFGPGWQGRYRARLVQGLDDLRNLLAYVHLNPVMAGLCKDPADFKLSGHREIIGRSTPVVIDVASALRCFEPKTKQLAIREYLGFVRHVAEVKWARSGMKDLPWWKPVRDDHQIVHESQAPLEARTFDDEVPLLPLSDHQPLGQLLEVATPLLGVSKLEITGTDKRPGVALARRRFIFIAANVFNHTVKATANILGKSSSQGSRWLRRETEAYYSDPEEAALIGEIIAVVLKLRSPSPRPTCA